MTDSGASGIQTDGEPARPAIAITIGIGPDSADGPATPPSIATTEVPFSACTVATAAQLPQVKALAASFLKAHPLARFVALIMDAKKGSTGPGIVSPLDIGLDQGELAIFATGCTAEQLCAVLRPRLLGRLLAEGGPVLYLDPAVSVLGSVSELVLPALSRAPLLLAPRTLTPLPDDGLRPSMEDLIKAGVYESGFLAVNAGAEAFLRSWSQSAWHNPDAATGFLDNAPALIDHEVLRDPGIGISVWNAGQRELHYDDDGTLLAGNVPVRTVHFPGFDPQRAWLLCADLAERPRLLLSENPVLARLCAEYRAVLVDSGFTGQQEEYGFSRLADGTAITDELRKQFRHEQVLAVRDGTSGPAPAFGERAAEFLDWASLPIHDQPNSTRAAAALWHDDLALQQRFPEPFSQDADAFREWCMSVGVTSKRLNLRMVPAAANTGALLDHLGVSVLGHGRYAEILALTARTSGLPTGTDLGYPVALCAERPSQLPAERYVVLLAAKPLTQLDTTGVDEVWALSEHAKELASTQIKVPIRIVSLPVLETPARTEDAQLAARTAFGIAHNTKVFAAVVNHDVESTENSLGIVTAFLTAFPNRSDVGLVLGISGADRHPEAAERLRLAALTDERITVVDEPENVAFLADTADWFVSLHRGDDPSADTIVFELTSVVARGISLVTSASRAAIELFNDRTAIFVPCRGAEPDCDAAAAVFRKLAGDPVSADRPGTLAREHLLRTRGLTAVAEQFRVDVEHAYRAWRSRRSAARPLLDADPLGPLHSAKHALLRRPDVGAASGNLMAPALRKAMLRALSHYDSHLRSVLSTVLDGVERTVGELVRRQDEVTARSDSAELASLRADIAHLASKRDGIDEQVSNLDDSVLRLTSDVMSQGRELRELQEVLVDEAAKRAQQVSTVADRLDRLTVMLDKTLDRIDGLESSVARALSDRDARAESSTRTVQDLLQLTHVLRQVVAREHSTRTESTAEPNTAVVLCEVGLLRLPVDDKTLLPSLVTNGFWQSDVAKVIDSSISSGGVFLDIGAHVGYHTLRVLGSRTFTGTVVAVEPCVRSRALLRCNVATNAASSAGERLLILEEAAWDTAEQLAVEPAEAGITVSSQPGSRSGELPEVPGVRLDKRLEGFLANDNLALSVVRVATPDYPHRVLGGMVRLLRRDRPHILCAFSPAGITDRGDDPIAVLREFQTWGYLLALPSGPWDLSAEQMIAALSEAVDGVVWLRPASGSSDREKVGVDQRI